MENQKKLALLGGDLRQYTAAVELSRRGWNVCLWGLDRSEHDPSISLAKTCREAVEHASAIVLPLPASTDGILLNAPFDTTEEHVRLNDILSMAEPSTLIVGGRIPGEFCLRAEAKGFRVTDYFHREDFQIQNAYTTAEAAVSLAMNALNKNLSDAKIAITGYGRIAKHLARLLQAMDSDVTVVARKDSDLAWAYSCGFRVIKLYADGKGIEQLSRGYDVIYNTVPHWIFDRGFLEAVDSSTFMIDLASVPGGFDICAAKELGSNVLWATSLPGKYAPISAGTLIAACVDDVLRDEVNGI